jgi:flagellar biosynthesis protein
MDKSPKAVALKYDRKKDRAPKVIAKGRGEIAEKIVAIAKANNIPLYEDKNLAQILEALDLEAEIPPELYRAVAEVLAFIYRLNGKLDA